MTHARAHVRKDIAAGSRDLGVTEAVEKWKSGKVRRLHATNDERPILYTSVGQCIEYRGCETMALAP